MNDDLTARERAVLLALMGVARAVSNPDLQRRAGLRLDGESRRRLNDRELVSSEMTGRSYAHELTKEGWEWCRHELTSERPSRAGSLGGALYAVLAGLAGYLDAAGLSLGAIFQGPADGPGADGEGPEAVSDVETQVRTAYTKLARQPRDWVRLADLRPSVVASRPDLDVVLTRLSRSQQATMMPAQDQRTLTPADEEAAIRIGGEAKHLISIG
jgi:hypothetical protein